MYVTFCGHSHVPDAGLVADALRVVIEELIREGADVFYLGGYGEFDAMAVSALWEAKKRYPHICSILVIPYLDRKYDLTHYDQSVYPPLEKVPPRYAISQRNRWMVEQADVVVSCVRYGWGGAAATLAYARRKKKRIVSVLPEAGETVCL